MKVLCLPRSAALAALDLDDPEYFEEEDLAAYSLACLQLASDERPGNPYADDEVAWPVACKIAGLSDRNFLVAGLISRGHGMHDEQAADPALIAFDAAVDSALAAYLERITPLAGLSTSQTLTGLAFAEAPGLSGRLWQAVVESLYGVAVSVAELSRFARSSAANFLVESRPDEAAPVFRLFRKALNQALLEARAQISSRGRRACPHPCTYRLRPRHRMGELPRVPAPIAARPRRRRRADR